LLGQTTSSGQKLKDGGQTKKQDTNQFNGETKPTAPPQKCQKILIANGTVRHQHQFAITVAPVTKREATQYFGNGVVQVCNQEPGQAQCPIQRGRALQNW
jgi:hypothetical protein